MRRLGDKNSQSHQGEGSQGDQQKHPWKAGMAGFHF
jgi:hypothetical protein